MPCRLCGDEPAKSIVELVAGDRHGDLEQDRLVEAVAPALVLGRRRPAAARIASRIACSERCDDLVGQRVDRVEAELVHSSRGCAPPTSLQAACA